MSFYVSQVKVPCSSNSKTLKWQLYSTCASPHKSLPISKLVSSCHHFSKNKTISSVQPAIVSRHLSERNFHVTPCPCQHSNTEGSITKSNNAKIDYKLHETVLNAMDANYHVQYVDEGNKNNPVVLCLHGMPACYKDFLPMLPKLVDGGARVILFNFPGVGYSWHLDGAPFDYSHLTKARLVEAFLSHLNIDKVNMLVSHSSSGHTGLQLCANTDLIQNVTFISSIAHLPHGQSKKTFMRDVLYNILKPPILRRLLGPTVLAVFRKISKMPIPEVGFFYGLMAESRTWNWKQAEADLKTVHDKDMPIMVMAAHKDPIVQLYISKGVMDLVGIAEEDRLTYTKDNTWQPADRKGKVNPLKHGVIFEKGSHWNHKAQPDIVATIILDFLKSTKLI